MWQAWWVGVKLESICRIWINRQSLKLIGWSVDNGVLVYFENLEDLELLSPHSLLAANGSPVWYSPHYSLLPHHILAGHLQLKLKRKKCI